MHPYGTHVLLALVFVFALSTFGWSNAIAQGSQFNDQDSIIFSFWQVVTSVIAIVVPVVFTIGWYAWTQKKERKRREKETRTALREELKAHVDDLALTQNEDTYVSSSGMEQKFVNRFFPTTAYDSVVYSGVITSFEHTEQYELSEIYWRFKMHNEMLLRLYDFHNEFFMEDVSQRRQKQWASRALPILELLTNWEGELVTKIKDVMKMM